MCLVENDSYYQLVRGVKNRKKPMRIDHKKLQNTQKSENDFPGRMLRIFFLSFGFSAIFLLTFHCANRLTPNPDDRRANGNSLCQSAKAVNSKNEAINQSCANARDNTNWVYFSFSNSEAIEPSDPTNSDEWDIGFQRFKIKVNGGVSGTGNTQIYLLIDGDFKSLSRAPSGVYIQDKTLTTPPPPITDQNACFVNDGVSYAFLNDSSDSTLKFCWFTYDFETHTLEARNQYYVLQATTNDSYYKIQFTSYYSETGTSGYINFRWAEINPR